MTAKELMIHVALIIHQRKNYIVCSLKMSCEMLCYWFLPINKYDFPQVSSQPNSTNVQDLPNAMSVNEVTEKLALNRLRNRDWYIQVWSLHITHISSMFSPNDLTEDVCNHW